jgi:hypothetical protein
LEKQKRIIGDLYKSKPLWSTSTAKLMNPPSRDTVDERHHEEVEPQAASEGSKRMKSRLPSSRDKRVSNHEHANKQMKYKSFIYHIFVYARSHLEHILLVHLLQCLFDVELSLSHQL